MSTKIKQTISLALLLFISQSLLGDIRLRTPFYKDVQVAYTPNEVINHSHYPQFRIHTTSSYILSDKIRSANMGTEYSSCGSIKSAPVKKYADMPSAEIQSVNVGAIYHAYGVSVGDTKNDAFIPANSSGETETFGRRNAPFAPPTEGSSVPIDDARLPLLVFALIYLILFKFKKGNHIGVGTEK